MHVGLQVSSAGALESWRPPQIQLWVWGLYNGGLGRSPQLGPGAEPLVRGQRAKPPWSWNPFGFWTFNGSRKFSHFSKMWNAKKSDRICAVFAKKPQYVTDYCALMKSNKLSTCLLILYFEYIF